MTTAHIIRALALTACGTLVCAQTTVPATVNPVKELKLMEGRGELLPFVKEILKVAISEPKVADAIVISQHEVMVNAKGPGHATLIVWEKDAPPSRYELTVAADGADIESYRKQVEGAGADIKLTGSGDTVVLTGKAATAEESKRAEGLAKTRAKNVINLLTVPVAAEPRQIMLQVKFASIDRAGLTELGFNFFSRNPKMLGELTTQQFQSPKFSQLQFQNQDFSNSTINFADLLNLFVFRPDLNIGATLRAMQQRNLLQVLAEPNLITLEGKEASFMAGGSFPFPTLTTTSTGGAVSPVVSVQFKPFGIQLTFTPTVLPSGAIDLKVSPEVSSLDYANAVTLQGFLIPAIAQRKVDTEVILKDGESFAIAGLIDNRVIKTISSIPGLGNIPILGNLFKSRSTRKSTDELLVVVTPRFVKPLPAGEKVKLPDMPDTFLPTLAEQKSFVNKQKKRDVKKAKTEKDKAEFVGARGYQEPKE